MALLDSELERIKAELGYNVLTTAATPYIGIAAVFEQVIQPYLSSGAATTSSTTVTAQTTPTAVAITLASATGVSTGDRLVIDVDSKQETATVRSLSGSVATVLLSLAHSGTYPVTVEGGEVIVRECLTEIRRIKGKMSQVAGEGSLKQVDEIAFYQGHRTQFGALGEQLAWWREQLAAALGIPSMWSRKRAGAQTIAMY